MPTLSFSFLYETNLMSACNTILYVNYDPYKCQCVPCPGIDYRVRLWVNKVSISIHLFLPLSYFPYSPFSTLILEELGLGLSPIPGKSLRGPRHIGGSGVDLDSEKGW